MKVFLIGYAGSGKSTTGKKLAAQLGIPFQDLDSYIEQRENQSIADLFSRYGESYFRQTESRELQELCQSEDSFLLACGGGTPCFFDNMETMKRAGLTVYLKAEPRFLADRVKQGDNRRPLLEGLEGESLVLFIQKQLSEREPYYNRADLVVTVPIKELLTPVNSIRDALGV